MPHGPRLSVEEFKERKARKAARGALPRPKRGRVPRWWTVGNSKLGMKVGNLNLVAGTGELGTCPGASGWCNTHCYAKRGWYVRKTLRLRRERNVTNLRAPGGLERFIREMNEDLTRYRLGFFRIHGSGDFFSPAYVLAWARIALANPRVRFLAYTHSWRVREEDHPLMRESLEAFRALPNVVLFASTDPDTEAAGEKPPQGWRVAAAGSTSTKGLPCPFYAKDRFGRQVQESFLSCGYCWKPVPPTSATFGNVLFHIHDNRPNGQRRPNPTAPIAPPAMATT